MVDNDPHMPNLPTMTAVLLATIRERGMSLYSISKAANVDKAALGRFVAGKQSLRLDKADAIAAHLGLVLMPQAGRNEAGEAGQRAGTNGTAGNAASAGAKRHTGFGRSRQTKR